MHAAQHGVAGVEGMIRHALLHSLAFDAQCEGDRGPWVMGMVDEAGVGNAMYPEFIRHVHDAPDEAYEYWHLSQRGTILGSLAKRGVSGARGALDRLFLDNRSKHPHEILGALDIIAADGEKGLVRVCAVLGDEAVARAAGSVEDWFLNVFDDDRGEGAALKVLEAERARNPGVDRFLSIRGAEQKKCQDVQLDAGSNSAPFGDGYTKLPHGYRRLPAELVIDWIQHAPHSEGDLPSSVEGRGWLRGWGMKASEASLDAVLRVLDATSSPVEQRRCLSVFSMRPMPRVSDRVVALAEDPDGRVRSRAYAALTNVSDPRIRAVGLRSLTPELIKAGSIKLLQSSYEAGDHRAIEAALFVPTDITELHSLIFDLAYVCAQAKLPECLTLMLFVYEYSPCGNCRSKVVDAMVELGIAPAWLEGECRFDAMEAIRERFQGPTLEG